MSRPEVDHAAAILDEIDPKWFERVDVSTLDMMSLDRCVLTQAFEGSFDDTMLKHDLFERTHTGVFAWGRHREDWVSAVEERLKPPAPQDWPKPSVTVDLTLFSADGHVLLVRRGKDPFRGVWALPGGFLNVDETGAEAAVRECLEETGARPEGTPEFLRLSDAVDRDPRGRVIGLAYAAVVEVPTPVEGADDAEEARWFSVFEIPLPLAFDHYDILNAGLKWAWRKLGGTNR